MKQRSNGKKDYSNHYPTDGQTDVYIKGYVQAIKEDKKHECDYVTFWIIDENDPTKDKDSFYEIIGTTIPWSLGQVELGDHLEVWGILKSWNKDGYVKLEVRVQQVKEIIEKPF